MGGDHIRCEGVGGGDRTGGPGGGHACDVGQPQRLEHAGRNARAGGDPHRTTPTTVLVDRGYRGVSPENPATRLIMSHTRRLAPSLKRLLKRRQVVEPMIGHMKTDGLFDRNWLKGKLGDALHAVMCGAGHNLRLILARLRALNWALIAVTTMLAYGRPTDRDAANAV